jgi:hypothetical protein
LCVNLDINNFLLQLSPPAPADPDRKFNSLL